VVTRDRVFVLRDHAGMVRRKLTNSRGRARVCCAHRDARPLCEACGDRELELGPGDDRVQDLRALRSGQLRDDSRDQDLRRTDDSDRGDGLAEVAQLR